MTTLVDTLKDDPRRPGRNPVSVPPGPGAECAGKRRKEPAGEPAGVEEPGSTYERRRAIFPAAVHGRYRRLKWAILSACLAAYWIGPWLRWDRGPSAPDQALLLDLAHRRFYVFGIEIWPQEFYYVAGLLIMAGLGLFLVTSIAGRAWCGYACPQTVWTDLFIAVERLVEGDRNARAKLAAAPWTLAKLRKRLTLWSLWLAIAAATGGAWIFYFADAPTLLVDLLTGTAAPVAYSTVAILTATTFWLAGFMREQVCTYMCPWPRIQGAMLDESSLIVTYNDWRGEPRSRHARKALAAGRNVGDCVDCNACVAACPMGIDIRNGQQLECITCALCIDACDAVMDKLGRPRGLVGYSTLKDDEHHRKTAGAQGRDAARAEQRSPSLAYVLRPRTILYLGLWSLIGLAMLVAMLSRGELGLAVLHDRAPLFTTLSDGSVRNGFDLKISNKAGEPRRLALALEGLDDAAMRTAEGDEPGRDVSVDAVPDAVRELRVFVTRPAGHAAPADFAFVLTDPASGESVATTARFEAKGTDRR